MQQFDLFLSNLRSIRLIIECNLSRWLTELWSNTTEVEIDGAIFALNFIFDEERDLDVRIFKEFVHLLAYNLVVIWLVVFAHFLKFVDHSYDFLLCRSALDHTLQCCQMLHRVEVDLFRLACLLRLILHPHQHQIEQLSHACGVQLHD